MSLNLMSKSFLGSVMALALCMSSIYTAAAASAHSTSFTQSHQTSSAVRATSGDLNKIEEELRQVFEVFLQVDSVTNKWTLGDIEAAIEAGVDTAVLTQIAADFNSAAEAPTFRKVGDAKWTRCVISWAAGNGVVELINGSVDGWLKRGKYAKVASWLVRVAPRLALRGGVIGVVAGLAAGVVSCSISH